MWFPGLHCLNWRVCIGDGIFFDPRAIPYSKRLQERGKEAIKCVLIKPWISIGQICREDIIVVKAGVRLGKSKKEKVNVSWIVLWKWIYARLFGAAESPQTNIPLKSSHNSSLEIKWKKNHITFLAPWTLRVTRVLLAVLEIFFITISLLLSPDDWKAFSLCYHNSIGLLLGWSQAARGICLPPVSTCFLCRFFCPCMFILWGKSCLRMVSVVV